MECSEKHPTFPLVCFQIGTHADHAAVDQGKVVTWSNDEFYHLTPDAEMAVIAQGVRKRRAKQRGEDFTEPEVRIIDRAMEFTNPGIILRDFS